MPYIITEMDETYLSIVRPTITNVTRQLMDKMGIKNNKIPVSFPGSDGKLSMLNSNNITDHRPASFDNVEKIIVEYRDEYNEDEILTLQSKKNEQSPIWSDTPLGIKLYPIYSRSKFNVSYTYQAQNRTQVERFRDHWRRKIAEGREYMYFDSDCIIPVPQLTVNILKILYNSKVRNDPNPITFLQYLQHYGCPNLTILTNGEGKGWTLAYAEKQTMFYGGFTDETPPEAEKQDEGDRWRVSFNFEFTYDKVISFGVKYPVVINNDLIHPVLYPKPVIDPREFRAVTNKSRDYFFRIQNMTGMSWYSRGACIRVPEFDDWSIDLEWQNQKPLVSALLLVDEEDPHNVCNLKVLDEDSGWGLSDALIPHFVNNRERLINRLLFPFKVTIYIDDVEMSPDNLYIDQDLNIRTKNPMKPHKRYHLVISAVYNPRLLTDDSQSYMLNHPDFACIWIDILLGRPPRSTYPQVNRNGRIDPTDFRLFFQREGVPFNDEGTFIGEPTGSIFACVKHFTVNAHQHGDLPNAYRKD